MICDVRRRCLCGPLVGAADPSLGGTVGELAWEGAVGDLRQMDARANGGCLKLQ